MATRLSGCMYKIMYINIIILMFEVIVFGVIIMFQVLLRSSVVNSNNAENKQFM